MGQNASPRAENRAKNICLCTPNGPGSILEKGIFDAFLVPKRPIFKSVWDFPWAKMRHHGLKTGQKHLCEHPKWSRNNLGKNLFFHPGHHAWARLPSGSTK